MVESTLPMAGAISIISGSKITPKSIVRIVVLFSDHRDNNQILYYLEIDIACFFHFTNSTTDTLKIRFFFSIKSKFSKFCSVVARRCKLTYALTFTKLFLTILRRKKFLEADVNILQNRHIYVKRNSGVCFPAALKSLIIFN